MLMTRKTERDQKIEHGDIDDWRQKVAIPSRD